MFGTSIKFVLDRNSYDGPFACLRVEIYGEPVPKPSGKSASNVRCLSARQKPHSSAFLTHTAKIARYVINCKPDLGISVLLFKQVLTRLIFNNFSLFYSAASDQKLVRIQAN